MPSYNKVLLMGNLTRDPELRYTASGLAVANFGLAVNETWGSGENKREETVFVDVTCWKRLAENVAQYLKKGAPAFVDGRLRLERWETQDGGKRSKLSVTAYSVTFLGSRDGSPPPQREKPPPVPEDDEIPF